MKQNWVLRRLSMYGMNLRNFKFLTTRSNYFCHYMSVTGLTTIGMPKRCLYKLLLVGEVGLLVAINH
jgi:hypothetical protein